MNVDVQSDYYARLGTLLCASKRAFRTRGEADAWAGRHYDCTICQTGARMTAYPCPVAHGWHIGHMTGTGTP